MTVLGQLVLGGALLATLFSAYEYFRATRRPSAGVAAARTLLHAGSLLVAVASALLLILLLKHDYSIGYIYSYSDSSLPLHYLLSCFYAGQEGSFLFWALCSSLIAILLRAHARRRGNESWVMTVFLGVQALLLFLLVIKSPFRSIWDVFPQIPSGQVPVEGRGLNPLLQNFWMVVHPPVLFIGFAAMAVPFSLTIAGLWKKDEQILVQQGFPWVLFSVALLGLGLMLGAYWAYGVLGWGGYWGWDPVENSSLVPWLTGAALLHTMLAQRRTGKYVRTNFALAIVSFFLVLYSTFLTRSGVLGDASVHSFTDPGAGAYWTLLAILALVAVTGGVFLALRFRELRPEQRDSSLLTRETSLGAGAIALLLSAAVVLFGTSLPIFSSIRVEPSFYDATNFPLAVAMLLLVGISLSMQWRLADGAMTLRRSWKPLAGSLLAGLVSWLLGARDAMALVLIVSAFFALAVNIDAAAKIIRGDPRFLGGKIAHAGMAVFLLGVIITGRFSAMEHVPLPLNQPRQVLGYTLTYQGYQQVAGGKYAFSVRAEKDGQADLLAPVMFETGDQGLMRNPDIESFWTRDLYLSPVSLDQQEASGSPAGETYTLKRGERISVAGVEVTFVKFALGEHDPAAGGGTNGEMAVGSVLELQQGTERETITPTTTYRLNAAPEYHPSASRLMKASLELISMHVGQGGNSSVTVGVRRAGTPPQRPETLAVEASVKPFIGLVWAGTVLMMGGFLLSILKRAKES